MYFTVFHYTCKNRCIPVFYIQSIGVFFNGKYFNLDNIVVIKATVITVKLTVLYCHMKIRFTVLLNEILPSTPASIVAFISRLFSFLMVLFSQRRTERWLQLTDTTSPSCCNTDGPRLPQKKRRVSPAAQDEATRRCTTSTRTRSPSNHASVPFAGKLLTVL